MSIHNNINGINKEVNNTKVNIDGTWREIKQSSNNVDGVWMTPKSKEYSTNIYYKGEIVATLTGESIQLPTASELNKFGVGANNDYLLYTTCPIKGYYWDTHSPGTIAIPGEEYFIIRTAFWSNSILFTDLTDIVCSNTVLSWGVPDSDISYGLIFAIRGYSVDDNGILGDLTTDKNKGPYICYNAFAYSSYTTVYLEKSLSLSDPYTLGVTKYPSGNNSYSFCYQANSIIPNRKNLFSPGSKIILMNINKYSHSENKAMQLSIPFNYGKKKYQNIFDYNW